MPLIAVHLSFYVINKCTSKNLTILHFEQMYNTYSSGIKGIELVLYLFQSILLRGANIVFLLSDLIFSGRLFVTGPHNVLIYNLQ